MNMPTKDHSDAVRTQGPTSLDDEQFKKLSTYIESELGIKMPPVKRVMLESRLQKRLRALKMQSFGEYLDLVFSDEATEGELVHMIDAVTTNKTDFFREPDHFDFLLGRLLPGEYETKGWGDGEPMKIWSSAASSGEEAYTIAMVLEEFREEHTRFRYRILGTDISTTMLERARRAIYPEDRIAPVAEGLRRKYLLRSKEKEARLVRVKPELRRNAVFHRLNLMADDFGISDVFHVIFCRNVIIYFDRNNQARLLRKLYDYLVPGGYLFLGHSETMAGMDLPLVSVAPTIYQKRM